MVKVGVVELPEKIRTPKQRIKLIGQAIRRSVEVENDLIRAEVKIYSNDLFVYSITVVDDEQLCLLGVGVRHNDQGEPGGYDQVTIGMDGTIRGVELMSDEEANKAASNDVALAISTGELLLSTVHKYAIETHRNRQT